MGVKQQFSAYIAADNEILEAIETFTEQSVVPENLVKQVQRYVYLQYMAADLLLCINYVGAFWHEQARRTPITTNNGVPDSTHGQSILHDICLETIVPCMPCSTSSH